jgi:Na+/H+-dicarboxylate symporter
LIVGLAAGAVTRGVGDGTGEPALTIAQLIGGLWLDALKMTAIPLIVALLITGIAQGAAAVKAGRLAARSVLWFVIVCTGSAIFAAVMMPLLLNMFPLGAESAAALRAGLAALDPGTASGEVPSVADFFRNIVPDNIFAAASNGEVLPLVVFALLFALALTRIDAARRRAVTSLFEAIADALLVLIGWVLWLAPLGVAALAFAVGAGAGGAAFAGLAHYILLVSTLGILVTLTGYVIAIVFGRVRPLVFARGMIAPQAVAISTQSSLASLPAMLGAARLIGVSHRTADVTLPLAVALFRATGPAMNLGVAIYVAHWFGTPLTPVGLTAATAVAALASYGAVSLPGQVSFFTSIAPIAMALGVPVAPLALLVAVEMVPDIFRTVGNVTLDVAVTTAVDRTNDEPAEGPNSG